MSRGVKEFLQAKAKADPKKVVFPESGEERILQAARHAADLGIAHPILIGKPEAIAAMAQSLGVSCDGITVVDHTDEATGG